MKRQFSELIEQKSPQITKVFNSPEQVIGKLIQSCYETQLQEYIRYRLVPMKRTNTELYLTETFKMFQKTSELSESLSKYRPGSDSTFTKKLQKSIFRDFTDRNKGNTRIIFCPNILEVKFKKAADE